MKFYLQFLCVTGCLKHSNDTPKLNIHKYTSYDKNMHKQIKYYNADVHSDGLLDNDVREVISFQKKIKEFGKDILFPLRRSNWIHELWKYFSNYVFRFLEDMYKNSKEIEIIKALSKLTIFENL